MKHYFYIWQLENVPADPLVLAALCKSYGIDGVAIKVLDGASRFNTDGGNDKRLKSMIDGLRGTGIDVELWGYHYPDSPGLQGDMIMERIEKLSTTVYLADLEIEWEQPFGMPKAAETMFSKVKRGGLQVLMTGARFPLNFPNTPWDKLDNLVEIDGFDPQIYWLGAHNPFDQAERCWQEYRDFTDKSIIPAGPCWGQNVKTAQGPVWWEPTAEELQQFRDWAVTRGIGKLYWWSLDWPLTHTRMDLVSFATGVIPQEPPPDPGYDTYEAIVDPAKCRGLNARVGPGTGNAAVLAFHPSSRVIVVGEDGDWRKIKLPADQELWVHGYYLRKI
ncbi:MAG: SH3 domain-containing protein [Candidatus Omnitrophota bacterium]|jgi:hypothetical protein|nr:MAG: SH3 domain-containing protein [Candidatus Omnitrophota bacterium]